MKGLELRNKDVAGKGRNARCPRASPQLGQRLVLCGDTKKLMRVMFSIPKWSA